MSMSFEKLSFQVDILPIPIVLTSCNDYALRILFCKTNIGTYLYLQEVYLYFEEFEDYVHFLRR